MAEERRGRWWLHAVGVLAVVAAALAAWWFSPGQQQKRRNAALFEAARLADAPWDYPWSSARAYALGVVDPLLGENSWYQELAKKPSRRRQLWQSFLLEEDPKEQEVQRMDWTLGEQGVSGADARYGGAA